MDFADRYYQGMTGTLVTGMGADTYQKQMVQLAKRQVELYERRGNELGQSQTNAILAREMQQSRKQAAELHEELIQQQSRSAEQITNSICTMERTLSGHLGELRWLAQQQQMTLDGILDALRHRRRNEAHELLQQGIKHLRVSEYAEAEERLLKALEFDTTDYQILMNLGFVKVHGNDPQAAAKFFQKALSLPDGLDDAAKARALWELARVHYAQGDYGNAYHTAEEAVNLEKKSVGRSLLTCGGYAALAGVTDVAVTRVEEAVRADSAMMGLALVVPDFDRIRDAVVQRLRALTEEAFERTNVLIEQIQRKLPDLLKMGSPWSEVADRIDTAISSIPAPVVDEPSYSDCAKLCPCLATLDEVLTEQRELLVRFQTIQGKVDSRSAEMRRLKAEAALGERTRSLLGNLNFSAQLITILGVLCAFVALVGTPVLWLFSEFYGSVCLGLLLISLAVTTGAYILTQNLPNASIKVGDKMNESCEAQKAISEPLTRMQAEWRGAQKRHLKTVEATAESLKHTIAVG